MADLPPPVGNRPVVILLNLEGNAPCGPACGVSWGLGVNHSRLPD